jgi:hypothetical protein
MNDAAVSDPKGDQAMVAGRPKDGFEVVMECPLLARGADLRHVVLDPACGPKAATRQAQSLQQASTYS